MSTMRRLGTAALEHLSTGKVYVHVKLPFVKFVEHDDSGARKLRLLSHLSCQHPSG